MFANFGIDRTDPAQDKQILVKAYSAPSQFRRRVTILWGAHWLVLLAPILAACGGGGGGGGGGPQTSSSALPASREAASIEPDDDPPADKTDPAPTTNTTNTTKTLVKSRPPPDPTSAEESVQTEVDPKETGPAETNKRETGQKETGQKDETPVTRDAAPPGLKKAEPADEIVTVDTSKPAGKPAPESETTHTPEVTLNTTTPGATADNDNGLDPPETSTTKDTPPPEPPDRGVASGEPLPSNASPKDTLSDKTPPADPPQRAEELPQGTPPQEPAPRKAPPADPPQNQNLPTNEPPLDRAEQGRTDEASPPANNQQTQSPQLPAPQVPGAKVTQTDVVPKGETGPKIASDNPKPVIAVNADRVTPETTTDNDNGLEPPETGTIIAPPPPEVVEDGVASGETPQNSPPTNTSQPGNPPPSGTPTKPNLVADPPQDRDLPPQETPAVKVTSVEPQQNQDPPTNVTPPVKAVELNQGVRDLPTFTGSNGGDRINGNAFANQLRGGKGGDALVGKDDNDIFFVGDVATTISTADLVVDFRSPRKGNDILNLGADVTEVWYKNFDFQKDGNVNDLIIYNNAGQRASGTDGNGGIYVILRDVGTGYTLTSDMLSDDAGTMIKTTKITSPPPVVLVARFANVAGVDDKIDQFHINWTGTTTYGGKAVLKNFNPEDGDQIGLLGQGDDAAPVPAKIYWKRENHLTDDAANEVVLYKDNAGTDVLAVIDEDFLIDKHDFVSPVTLIEIA